VANGFSEYYLQLATTFLREDSVGLVLRVEERSWGSGRTECRIRQPQR